MSSFQNLKDSVSRVREISSDFSEWDKTNFPEGKLGSGDLDADTACHLFEYFVDTIESAFGDETLCIESLSPGEMSQVGDALANTAQALQDNNVGFVNHVEELIVFIRPFEILPLIDAREASASLKKQVSAMKHRIDRFPPLLEGVEKKIAAQEAATDEYKTKLTELSAAAVEAEAARDKEHKKGLAEFAANCASSMENVQKLIGSAETALQLKTAEGLGAAFRAKEEKSGNQWVKLAWLVLGLLAAIAAIILGWLISSGTSDVGTVLGRALVMLVAVGVAGFAGRQYAKNKAIEEDYAYKAALVTSYPGFASKLDNEEMQKQYTSQLLAEILQDPQRVRKAEKKNPLSDKDKSSN